MLAGVSVIYIGRGCIQAEEEEFGVLEFRLESCALRYVVSDDIHLVEQAQRGEHIVDYGHMSACSRNLTYP